MCVAEELELNVVGAPVDEEDQHLWSPGELKYYSRTELKTSDHRYSNTKPNTSASFQGLQILFKALKICHDIVGVCIENMSVYIL